MGISSWKYGWDSKIVRYFRVWTSHTSQKFSKLQFQCETWSSTSGSFGIYHDIPHFWTNPQETDQDHHHAWPLGVGPGAFHAALRPFSSPHGTGGRYSLSLVQPLDNSLPRRCRSGWLSSARVATVNLPVLPTISNCNICNPLALRLATKHSYGKSVFFPGKSSN